jgi:hypothetical protein
LVSVETEEAALVITGINGNRPGGTIATLGWDSEVS